MGQFVFARTSVGFDGLLNYYKGRNEVCDLEIEKAFMKHTGWSDLLPKPYFIDADPSLAELFRDVTIEGITIAAPGFYAPQGRWVRLEPADIHLNEKIESFDYHRRRITNFEMESSALPGWPLSWATKPPRSVRSSPSGSRWTPARIINLSSER